MKATILTAILMLGLAAIVPAQRTETFTLKPGQQKRAGRGDIRVRFVSVVEDSRCPEKSACIWAGNAKIEVVISDRHGSATVTMNTNTGNHGDQYGGWAINLVSVSQKQEGKMLPSRYRAIFSVSRLHR